MHLYGSTRLGMVTQRSAADSLGIALSGGFGTAKELTFTRAEKIFELSNHLGNVLVTVSDRRLSADDGEGAVAYYEADVVTANDYYPFGMGMVGRKWTSPAGAGEGGYRYGFNGKENGDDVKGEGNQQDYGMRIYDPRLGRFLSIDPLFKTFAMLTPYQFASNTPIAAIDLDGLEAKIAIYGAGVKRDANGNIIERHESQFKREADKDVKQQNANVSLAIHNGDVLVQTLKDYTKSEGSIEYISIASHSGPSGIILDNGQYGLEVVGHPSTANWTNCQGNSYTSTDIDNISNNADIKLASNALVVFAGCNAGRTVAFSDGKTAIYSVAKDFTERSGVASIGAYGYTAPSGQGGGIEGQTMSIVFFIMTKMECFNKCPWVKN